MQSSVSRTKDRLGNQGCEDWRYFAPSRASTPWKDTPSLASIVWHSASSDINEDDNDDGADAQDNEDKEEDKDDNGEGKNLAMQLAFTRTKREKPVEDTWIAEGLVGITRRATFWQISFRITSSLRWDRRDGIYQPTSLTMTRPLFSESLLPLVAQGWASVHRSSSSRAVVLLTLSPLCVREPLPSLRRSMVGCSFSLVHLVLIAHSHSSSSSFPSSSLLVSILKVSLALCGV